MSPDGAGVRAAGERAGAAASSASSNSSADAWSSSARSRRISVTGTTTAAWPPKWITSYDPVSGRPGSAPEGCPGSAPGRQMLPDGMS